MKRIDRHGCDITDLTGLYNDTDTIIDPGCYVCLSVHPVAAWEPEDDPWAECYDRMMRQLREALDWIGGDWMAGEIFEQIDDDTWAVIVEHGLEGALRAAIDRMVDAKALEHKLLESGDYAIDLEGEVNHAIGERDEEMEQRVKLEEEVIKMREEIDRLRLKAVDLGGQVVSQAEEIERLKAEFSNAHSFIYNITPNRTVEDMLPSLDEQIELLRQRLC